MPVAPRDLVDLILRRMVDRSSVSFGDHLADHATIEFPLAPDGHPRRFDGKRSFLTFAGPRREALPIRFDGCRTTAMHETADPDTVIVEYELTGTSTVTQRQATAPFVAVVTVHDGMVTRWREYQDTASIARAMSTDPLPA
jgi:uncharacterized protein